MESHLPMKHTNRRDELPSLRSLDGRVDVGWCFLLCGGTVNDDFHGHDLIPTTGGTGRWTINLNKGASSQQEQTANLADIPLKFVFPPVFDDASYSVLFVGIKALRIDQIESG